MTDQTQIRLNPNVSEELRLANVAFFRDLPKLLSEHHGRWTAYVGAERKGIADRRDTLLRKYRDDFLAGKMLLAKIREHSSMEAMGF